MADERNPSLKNRRVITHQALVMGIPQKIFFGAVVLCGFGVVTFITYLPIVLGILVSLFLIFLFFAPLYIVHKDDSEAWQVFIKLFKNSNHFTPVYIEQKDLVVLIEKSDTFEHQSLTSIRGKKS